MLIILFGKRKSSLLLLRNWIINSVCVFAYLRISELARPIANNSGYVTARMSSSAWGLSGTTL
jgi:hypothetical protein